MSRRTRLARRRMDERGAVAVFVALTSVLLLSFATIGVDLGQAWAQKRQLQEASDLATLAGAGISGADLPAPNTGKVCSYGTGAISTDPAAIDVAKYVASNADSSLAPDSVTSSSYTAMAQQLTDCDVTNGEIFYGIPKYTGATNSWSLTYNKNQLSLVSPPKTVNFGFANLIGFSNVKVVSQSTIEIRSPNVSALPFYAFSGCDYGPQTLQQPNNGHAADSVTLALDGQPAPASANTAVLTSVSPTSYPVDTSSTLEPITITGTNLTGVTEVGFFESAVGGSTAPAPVRSTNITVNAAGTQITMPDIPSQTRGVAGVQEFWYIRVLKNSQWSAVWTSSSHTTLNTPILTIGNPPLICGQGSNNGNFGTLSLSHAGYNGADSVGSANVALGLTNYLSIYPTGGPSDGTCSSAQTTTVLWNTDGTNCVDTDTGMSSKVATGGFLGQGSSAPSCSWSPCGLLAKPSTTKCGPSNSASTTQINGQTYNNDNLSCFFTDSSTHVGDVDSQTYTLTGPAISKDIYNSPRFVYVPVLAAQPANGGSKKYQIVDFRAGFITDQPASALKGDNSTSTNGVVMSSNGNSVESITVIFLNPNALPTPPVTNGTITYTGSGVKIPLLVN